MRRIKILEEISSDKGYSDAILTTFKFNRFFETDVLQTLRDSGVENVMLLIDETEYQQKYSKAKEHGVKYYLEPIRLNGTFHPKVLLLVGSEKAKLIVTSANLTDTAYKRNAEIATLINLDDSKDIQKLFAEAGKFFVKIAEDFVRSEKSKEVIKDILSDPPWKEPSGKVEEPRIRFIHNLSIPIIEQINSEEKWSKIQVLSPYYDMKLSALEAITELGNGIELYLQNKATNLPKNRMKKLFGDSMPIYDLTFPKENQSLHGKAIWFHNNNSQVLFGSANLSRPALEMTPPEGNIEACLLLNDKIDEEPNLLENEYIESEKIGLKKLETQEENPDEARDKTRKFPLTDVFLNEDEEILVCKFDFSVPDNPKLEIIVEGPNGEILKDTTVEEKVTGALEIEMKGFEQRDLIGTDVRLKVFEDEKLIAESLPRRAWNPFQKMLGDAERSLKSVWKKQGEDFLKQAIDFGEKNQTNELEFIHLFYTYALENVEDLTEKIRLEKDDAPVVGKRVGEEVDPESHSPFQPGELDTYNLNKWNPEEFKTIEKVLQEIEKKFTDIKKPDTAFLSEESFMQFFNFLKIIAKEVFLREKKEKMIEETNPVAKLKEHIVKKYIEEVIPTAREQFGEKKFDYLQKRAGVGEHLMIWWYLTDYYLKKRYDSSGYNSVSSLYMDTYKSGIQKANEFSPENLTKALEDYELIMSSSRKDIVHARKRLEIS